MKDYTSLLDDETVCEMGHELEVLLLLVHAHHLQLLPEQALELLPEGEREGQPTHVGTIASL